MRKGEAESLVVADGREEAGAGGDKSSELRRQWRAAVRLLRAGERESERASGGARLVVRAKADAAGQTWWPTRARPSRRMRATRQPNAAGVPRRRGTAVRARGRGAGASARKGQARAGWASFGQRARSEAAAC